MEKDTAQTGILAVLDEMVDKQLREEIIGGVCIADVVDAVMLDVAFTPVIPTRGSVRPVEAIETEGGEMFILRTDPPESVHRESLKIMRARFLLQKDSFFQMLVRGGGVLNDHNRRCVIGLFWPKGVFVPGDGNPLKEVMLRENWKLSDHEMAAICNGEL
jgi:hypothetical protein